MNKAIIGKVLLVMGLIFGILGVLGAPANAAQPTGSNANQASNWETHLLNDKNIVAECYSHEGAEGSYAHGDVEEADEWWRSNAQDGKTYVDLDAFQQSWFGDHWALLVVKGGSAGGPNNDGNAIYYNPNSTTEYFAPINPSNNKHFDVSHWIVCKGEARVQVTPVAPGVLPGTCEAPGSIVANSTAQYTWSITGPITARVATATAVGSVLLTGQTVYGPYDLSQIVGLPCAGSQPEDLTRQTVTTFVDCEAGTHTTTTTNFRTPYILSGSTWVPGVEVQDGDAVVIVREATAAELNGAQCEAPEQPEDIVVYSDWVDGTYECGDTTVTQTREKSVTTHTYDVESRTWIAGTPVVTEENQIRDLTEDEIIDCEIPANPEFTVEQECGSITFTFTNNVELGEHEVTSDATFFLDGETITVTPNGEAVVRTFTFDEDAEDAVVVLGEVEYEVETDCVTPPTTTTTPPTTTPTTTVAPTTVLIYDEVPAVEASSVVEANELAFTGTSAVERNLMIAGGLLALGAAFLIVSRRRNETA